MPANLIELIGRENLWAVGSEVAGHLQEDINNIAELQFWGVGLWVKRRHDLATVVSYRQLSCWIPVVGQTIVSSPNLDHLRQLQTALEVDFEKRSYAYPQEAREELRQLLGQRQAQLEAETTTLWKAEMLTRGHSRMIEHCQNKAELDWVKQVIREQSPYLKPYPHLLDYLREIWTQQAKYLRGLAAA